MDPSLEVAQGGFMDQIYLEQASSSVEGCSAPHEK